MVFVSRGNLGGFLLAVAASVPAALAGCRNDLPRPISAELLEVGESDNPTPDPIILITLDRPLPVGFTAERIRVIAQQQDGEAPADWSPPVELPAEGGASAFHVRLRGGSPRLEPRGLFRQDQDASGIGVDLGRGPEWVDIVERQSPPVLKRVIWLDRAPEAAAEGGADGPPRLARGNCAVDQGDVLRLIFNRDVRPRPDLGPEELRMRVPGDLILTAAGDRLDDGEVPAALVESQEPREIWVMLGSNPRLTPFPAPRLAASPRGGFEPLPGSFVRPSGIAVNGTTVQPLEKIVDRRSGLGATSSREVGIELPEDHPHPLDLSDRFPDPGPRTFLTATAVIAERVVLAGGLNQGAGPFPEPLDQVLLYRPEAPDGERFEVIGTLSQARYLHTATTLPGDDGIEGTADDPAVIIAGGTDGDRSLSTLEAIRPDGALRFRVERLQQELRLPRHHHAAVAIPPDRIAFIGGLDQDLRGASGQTAGLIAKAEILTFAAGRGGRIEVRERFEVRTVPRMHHTATRLGSAPAPGGWPILIYGGLGIPAPAIDGGEPFPERFPDSRAMILASPELLWLPGSGPPAEPVRIDVPFDYARLRYDHLAAAVPAPGPPQALISGGSLRPPGQGNVGVVIRRDAWELPAARYVDRESLLPPLGSECAQSLLFTLDPEEPLRSTVEILPSPTGERRVHHALVPLPGLGLVALGGESPEPTLETWLTGEIFLTRERALLPFSVFLNGGRSRFGAVFIRPGRSSLFLFGGAGSSTGGNGIPHVEEIRFP